MRPHLLALLVLFTVALVGCDDDEPSRITRFSGHLVFVGDESPLPDLVVTLFEPDSQIAVDKTVSDADGYFEFTAFPPGSYIPVVHADGYRPVFLPRARWRFEKGDRVDVTLRLRETLPMPGADLTLTCRVTEQGSDPPKPIANARAEMNFFTPGELSEVNWSEYTGWSNTLEATSDAEGMLQLAPVQLIYTGVGLESFIPEFRVTAPGYRARVIPPNDDPATAAVSLIGVRLVPGEDMGHIAGVVRGPDGAPLANVPVSAEWRRVSDLLLRGLEPAEGFSGPQSLLIPDGVAYTGPDGAFDIGGLPKGYYNVLAGPYPDDGWVGFVVRGVEIPSFNGTGQVELRGFRAMLPVTPDDGEVFGQVPDRIEWTPVDGATAYDLTIIRGYDGASAYWADLTEPSFVINPGANFFKDGDSFAWKVEATNALGEGLSMTDRPYVFHVVESPQPD